MMMCCAACGIAGADDIKLKKCTACKSVRYCSVKCQKEHRPKHKKECKKRGAELRDEILFKQPESSDFGDCPICCIPLPINAQGSTLMACCSKTICNGCVHANKIHQLEENLEESCLFCRRPAPDSDDEIKKDLMRRIEVNDPAAMRHMGTFCHQEEDYGGAFEYYTKAAELGDATAHYLLSCMYHAGKGVERDEKKKVYHLEEASIGGNPFARNNLAIIDTMHWRIERAVKHYIIAAKLGHDGALQSVKDLHERCFISKEDLAAILRDHQAAADAMKSPHREAAKAFLHDED